MRRNVGVTFTGLGAFLLVLALMSRFFLPGQVIKFPLNEYSLTRLTGTNVTYFSLATGGQELNGRTARLSVVTQGNVSAGTSSVAVWTSNGGLFDVTSGGKGQPISYPSETFAFDRRTGQLVNCCSASVGTAHPHFSGQGFVWPIGTKKQNYQIFDTTLLKPEPAVYSGTAVVDGMTTYVFVEHVSNQQYGTQSVPGSLVGSSQSELTLPEILNATNTYFVDPGTGSPVKIIEKQAESLNYSSGSPALYLFNGTLTTTPQSVQSAVNTASSYDTDITWVQNLGPLVAGIVGIVLLLLGLVMIIGERREEYDYYDEEEDEVGAEA
jgi:Porin PorA